MLTICAADAVAIFQGIGFKGADGWNKKKMNKKLQLMATDDDFEDMEVDEDLVEDEDEQERLNSLIVALRSEKEFELVKELKAKKEEEEDADDEVEDDENSDADSDDDDEETDEEEAEVSDDEDDDKDQDDEDEEDDEDDADDEVEDEEEEEEVKPPKAKKEKKEKPAKPAKEKKEKKPKAPKATKSRRKDLGPDVGKPVGITSLKNRLFLAGMILKKSGVEPGLTDDLITELNDEFMALEGKESNIKASATQLGMAWHVVNGYLNG